VDLSDAKLVAKHTPDENGGPFSSIQDAIKAGYDTVNPVTGVVTVGIETNGAFIPIMTEKASLVYDAIELAKANAPADDGSSSAASSTPDQGSSEPTPDTGPLASGTTQQA
jgi:hypothetical protein